jgi:hypothetical protein
MLTFVLVILVLAAGFAVDRYAFKGEFMRLVIAEISYVLAGRPPAEAEADSDAPRRIFGRRQD